MLWVCSTDFQKNLTEFDPMTAKPPTQVSYALLTLFESHGRWQLVWCGVDSVMLYWNISQDKDKLLLMVGPKGDWVKYSYRNPLVLISECDGVRIVSNDKCEFLHRVPKSTEDVFKIGSLEPAAILHDAIGLFEDHNARVTYP